MVMNQLPFSGKILVIGYGSVSRCALPLLFKHIQVDPRNVTVMDFAESVDPTNILAFGANFVREKIEQATMGQQLAEYVGKGDLIIDLAWNIGAEDVLQWCRDHEVLYVNTSVEQWDPYEGKDTKPPQERTLYHRQMSIRRLIAGWPNNKGTTAVLDHGANPGLVSHFTKQALRDIATKWLADHHGQNAQRERIESALDEGEFNKLAMALGVCTIHISERDMQIANQPKKKDEFVNTWSIEGFYEEGIAPAEMGWGTHEKCLPPRAFVHRDGPGNQICLASFGCRTWVKSWVPAGEILGMVIRHGEAFSISDHLTVWDGNKPLYRPTVHYAYCPCDAAVASLHELHMRNFQLQPELRIMSDEILSGQDQLGCLLMGHDYKSWWIGSTLSIEESRRLVPHQNATTLQVACSVIAAACWMIEHPKQGVCLPDALPYEYILNRAKPYLGKHFVSEEVDWTPLDTWDNAFERFGVPRPSDEDVWQFTTFLERMG